MHKRRYNPRRPQVALRQKGHRVGRQRLRTAMRRRGLRALQPKAYTPRTTDSTHGLRCAPNRLLDQPKPTQAAARALNIDPKRIYQWQKAVQTPVAAALGVALDPATAAKLRQLRALARRQAQELDMLKKAIASKRLRRVISQTPDQ